MKYLKVIIYALLGIITTYLISNFFFNEKLKVRTSITIESSPFIIYDQINNFENWKNWDPWLITDTTIKINTSDKTFGVGAYRTWKSENSGNGRMEITNAEYIKQIDFEINIDRNHQFFAIFYIDSFDDKVKLSWENKVRLPFISRVFGPVISKMMKRDHIKGLNLIKEYCESIPSKSSDPSVKEWEYQNIIAITDTCSSSTISQSLTKIYNKITKYMSINNIESNKPPFVQYLSFPQKPGDNDYIVLRAGVFVNQLTENEDSKLEFYKKTKKLSVQAIHKGDYRSIFDTHRKIKLYCKEKKYTIVKNPYEIFLSNPAITKDIANWETLLIYEIK